MSLYESAKETCRRYVTERYEDGRGGMVDVWSAGEDFEAAIMLHSSGEGAIGLAQKADDEYMVYVSKSVNLQYHDVFMRLSDGTFFRVETEGTDNHTPSSAWLDMRAVKAKMWELTDYEQ